MPTVVDSCGLIGSATALPGAPPIAALVGDQQASLLGQACVRPGPAKITFGTGAMLDMVVGPDRPTFETRGNGGTFPIITWRVDGTDTWGLEAIMLAAGTNVEWLRDDLGIIASSDESHEVAQQCADSGGVVFVPALLGLGTPQWDFGARGTVLGLTRGSGRPELVRAVLEGVAQSGADLVEAAETDAGRTIDVAAHRRWDVAQPDVRAGARRRGAEAGRGVAGEGGDDARRRVPRRPRRRHSGRTSTRSTTRGNRSPATSRANRSTATRGGEPSNAPAAGSPSSPPSTSRRPRAVRLTCGTPE